MSKTFTVVGVSRAKAKDPFKFRVANGSAEDRTKRLIRSGFMDVQMFDIEPTSKLEALDWFEKNHPDLLSQVGNKQIQAMRGKLKLKQMLKLRAKPLRPSVVGSLKWLKQKKQNPSVVGSLRKPLKQKMRAS